MTFTSDELISHLKNLAEGKFLLEAKQDIQTIAANTINALLKNRVFKEGKDADGAEIGQYSEFPFSVPFRELQEQGIPNLGRIGKKKINKKGFAFFEGGYKELRELIGRPTDNVKLEITESSRNQLKTAKAGQDIAFGFTNKERLDIQESNELRFGTVVFKPTKSELKESEKAIRIEVKRVMDKAFS